MEEDKNWYKAELDGKEGYIPSNYIELKPHTCVNLSLSSSITECCFSIVIVCNYIQLMRSEKYVPKVKKLSAALLEDNNISHCWPNQLNIVVLCQIWQLKAKFYNFCKLTYWKIYNVVFVYILM